MLRVVPMLIALLVSAAQPSNAQSALNAFVGEWRGQGLSASDPTEPPKRTRCRVEAVAKAKSASIIMTGKCAIAAGQSRFSARFVDDGNGRVRAGFNAPLIEETAQLAGNMTSGKIEMTGRAPYLFEGTLYHIRTQIDFEAPDEFVLREWNAVDGTQDWKIVKELTFKRSEGE